MQQAIQHSPIWSDAEAIEFLIFLTIGAIVLGRFIFQKYKLKRRFS